MEETNTNRERLKEMFIHYGLNKEDIFYGLESSSIQKLLVKKNYKPQELIKIFY